MTVGHWSRAEFLKTLGLLGTLAACPPGAALAGLRPVRQDVLRIGFLLPPGPIGDAAARGSELGAEEAGQMAELLGTSAEVIVRRPAADSLLGEARRLIDETGVLAIAGGLDEEACDSLGALAEESGILYLNVGCASDRLRGERCRHTSFHVEASTAMYVDATAEWLVGEQGLRRWHFLVRAEDDPVYVGARRAAAAGGAEEAGRSVVARDGLDADRLVGELAAAGVEVAFLALDDRMREQFLAAHCRAGAEFIVTGPAISTAQLASMAGEAPVGVWPTLWHHRLFRYGAAQLNDRYAERFGEPMEARAWASWLAVKIVVETALRARVSDPLELMEVLETERAQFDGHKGIRLSFRPWDHQLRQPVYLVRAAETESGDPFEHVADLPRAATGPDRSAADVLDELGHTRSESECVFSEP